MPGMGVIPKEETYNKYGDSARKIEIGTIGGDVAFARIPFSEATAGASLIEGIFVYAVKNKINVDRPRQNRGIRWRK